MSRAFSDDAEPSEADTLWSKLCCGIGSRAFLVQQVRAHLLSIAGSLALTLVSFVVDAACGGVGGGRCSIVGAAAGHWLRLCAFALAISPPTALADKLLFAAIAQAGAAFTRAASSRPTPALAAFLFYAVSFEESVGRILWLVVVIAYEEVAQLVDGVQAAAADRVLLTMLIWVVIVIARTVIVRVASRSLLLASFEWKVADSIFASAAVLGLTLPQARESGGVIAPAGRGNSEGDAIFRSLIELVNSKDAARKLDAAASLQLVAWDPGSSKRADAVARLVTIVKPSEVMRLARKAFRALVALPADSLPAVVKVSTEEMLVHKRVVESEGVAAVAGAAAAAALAPQGFTASPPDWRGRSKYTRLGEETTTTVVASMGPLSSEAVAPPPNAAGARSHSAIGLASVRSSPSMRPALSAATFVPPAPALPDAPARSSPSMRPALSASTFVPPAALSDVPARSSLSIPSAPSTADSVVAPLPASSDATHKTLPRLTSDSTITVTVYSPERRAVNIGVGSSSARSSSAPRSRASSRVLLSGIPGAASAGITVFDAWPDDARGKISESLPQVSQGSVGRLSGSLGRLSARVAAASWKTDALASHKSIGGIIGAQLRSAVREVMSVPLRDSPGGDSPSFDVGRSEDAGIKALPGDRLLLHKLSLAHFAAALGVEDASFYERAFALCDKDGDGKCTLDEFITFFENVYSDLQSLKSSLSGSESSVSALSFLANAVALVATAIAAFVIFEVSLTAVVVPLSTLFVSLSFAVGPSVSNVVGSLIFVFERRFDVGDRVTSSIVGPPGEILTVQRIDVLTTSFLTFTNRHVCVPNFSLASSVIENLTRSPAANVHLALSVSTRTTSKQLEALQSRLRRFTEAESSSFKPGVFFRVRGIEHGNMLLSVWASSHYSYGQAPECYRGIFSLWLATMESLRAEQIECRIADQAIELRASAATDGALARMLASAGGGVKIV